MKKRIRSIGRYFIRAGWMFPVVLLPATGANRAYPLTGQQPSGAGLNQPFEAAIYVKVNEARAERGLPELAWASDVADVARMHSEDMAAKGYFAHVNQEAETLNTRLEKAGIAFTVSAENLFASDDFIGIADESVKRWMESPGHRDNLLNASVTDTGVGIYRAPKGRIYYITQVFIKRALKIFPSPSRLSLREVDTIFDIISASIKKSKNDFDCSQVKKSIVEELAQTGIPVKENIYIEGFLKDVPVLRMTVDLIAGDGFIVKFTEGDPDNDLEAYSRLVHPQGYSAAVLINEVDGEVRFPLIKIKQSDIE